MVALSTIAMEKSSSIGEARLKIYFPGYAGTKLHCFVTDAHVGKEIVEGCYPESNPQQRDR